MLSIIKIPWNNFRNHTKLKVVFVGINWTMSFFMTLVNDHVSFCAACYSIIISNPATLPIPENCSYIFQSPFRKMSCWVKKNEVFILCSFYFIWALLSDKRKIKLYYTVCIHTAFWTQNSNIVELMQRESYMQPLKTVLNQWAGSGLSTSVCGLTDVI